MLTIANHGLFDSKIGDVMSIIPTKEDDDAARNAIGNLVETAYQIHRASRGKQYKPMGQEEIVEPIGRKIGEWTEKVTGSRTGRERS
jgi:hypothetical protein